MAIIKIARRILRTNLQLLLVLIVLLVALRVALPHLVKWYVNKTLDEMPEYAGSIGDVDLKLWRGAYEIEKVDIIKTDGDVPVPFFSSKKVEFSVQWRALFEGALVGEIAFFQPEVNFVNGPTKETKQVGVDKPWLDTVKKLFPLDINRFEVFDGSVHYRDFHSSPKVNLEIDRIYMLATNLTNSKKLSKTLVADIKMKGRTFKESDFEVTTKLDPSRDKPTFDLNMKMDPVSLTKLNDFAQAYGKFDFERGTLALVIELAALDGNVSGYAKPLLDNMAIVNLREDVTNPVKLAWEGIVGGITRVFRNQPKDRLATKIPIEGDLSKPKTLLFPTLGNILKNAFIRAYKGNVEESVTLKDALEEKSQADEKKAKR